MTDIIALTSVHLIETVRFSDKLSTMILYVSRVFDTPKMFMLQRLNDCLGMRMGIGRNENSPVGIPWEWELVTKLGMGVERNGN